MEEAVYLKTQVEHIIVVTSDSLIAKDSRTMSWDCYMKLGENVTFLEVHRAPTDLLFLASTGGSTGEPKCVMYSDNSFNFTVHQYINSPHRYKPTHRWHRMWPIFSGTAAVVSQHMPLCVGMVSVLKSINSITEFPEVLMAIKPNNLIIMPQIFDVMVHSKLLENQDLSFLISAGCGGMSLSTWLEKEIENFFEIHHIDAYVGTGWGCTESATIGASRFSHETSAVGGVGVPFVSSVVSAFDTKTELECTYEQEGELCICYDGVMMGYYNDPDMTNKVLRTHADGKKWLHTGDLGTVDKDGIVRVSGRMRRMIMVSENAKIYPTAIENEISQISGVREVALCAVPKDNGFFDMICFVVPEKTENSEAVRREVEEFCVMRYPEDTRPKKYNIVSEFPLTKVGKIDYLALEKVAED